MPSGRDPGAAWRTCRTTSRRRSSGRRARVSSASRRRAGATPRSVRSPMSSDLAVHHPLTAVKREVEAVRVPLHHRPVAHQPGVRAGLHRLVEVAGVVDVVVGQEDPAHVLGLDQRNTSSSHCSRLAMVPVSTIIGSRAQDHHRVQVDEQRLAERLLNGVDDPGVGGDLRRSHLGRRARWCERHRNSIHRAPGGSRQRHGTIIGDPDGPRIRASTHGPGNPDPHGRRRSGRGPGQHGCGGGHDRQGWHRWP